MSQPGPQPPQAEPQPEPVQRVAGSRAGMVGALLYAGAAVLVMIGVLQDLLTVREAFGTTFTITTWEARLESGGVTESQEDGAPLNVVPLLIAVVLLIGAAGLGIIGASRRSGRRLARPTALVATVATTFLTATVIMVGVQVLWWIDLFEQVDGESEGPARRSVDVGPGYWSLVIGAALAIVAAGMAWRRARAEPQPEREEPETPRLGIPVVVRRLPDAEPDKPDG